MTREVNEVGMRATLADAMAVATAAWYTRITPQPTVHGKLEEFARALTEYGDQRAREARQAQLGEGYCMVCGVYHRVGSCAAIEKAAREARAAAIEEAAQIVEEHSKAPKGITWGKLKTAIRALADTPPLGRAEHARSDGQTEGGEG